MASSVHMEKRGTLKLTQGLCPLLETLKPVFAFLKDVLAAQTGTLTPLASTL